MEWHHCVCCLDMALTGCLPTPPKPDVESSLAELPLGASEGHWWEPSA